MSLKKFADALPIPPVLKPKGNYDGIPFYEVTMRQVKQKLHRDLPPTTVWGYNSMYPGPTFEVERNHPIFVKWKNKLPFEHLLPVDQTVHGAESNQPSVRTVVHLHGGRVRPESDGYPDAWFTRDFKNVGTKFVTEVYYYPNCQRPTTLWYHDHAIGITRLNVYAGLAGFYLLRDEEEKKLNLPSGKFEIPLVIQDRSFYANGELFYPSQPGNMPPPAPQPPPPIDPALPNPSVVPEFFGNTILVNGKVWPYLEVEPRKYRFRILNGSNSRFYRMQLSSGQNFVQIGTDGGLLEKPVLVSELILAPAERADVIVDFSNHNGENIILTNDAPTPFPDGESPSGDLKQIMQFRVKQTCYKPDKSKIPEKLSCLEQLNPQDAVMTRKNTLLEATDKFGRPMPLLNNLEWNQPITESPYNGTIEIWELYNTTPDTHPIHLHLVNFQILNRAVFTGDPTGFNLKVGPPIPPDPNERGWKDTVRANPGEVTRIIARFGPFTGTYPWHCHILEHEDYDMMRPYEVLANPSFNPREQNPEQCSDNSFSQCFDCHKRRKDKCSKKRRCDDD
ncbi:MULTISPECIES: multicopper oxidase family protein [unclassified Bacillus (in: firmicutes)]|uniref:multicopper oxidase family protein n=1 Tax=unclassified Bacillus (in: firmicutes) TaxID=185979 RepID=UPI0008E1BA1C|nr:MULTISPECIES: multicopper oxidase [unclassified Bacillus (in: firmicutes)]SFJ74522.1 spore coat protein A [Bacillus sp. 71mf]SFS69037.1 spore coat protein A [Bacillus sp. 103mf]